jgi:transposase
MFIRHKTFIRKNGNKATYLYLVENRRFKDKDKPGKSKVKQITIGSLGRLEVVQSKIPALIKHFDKWAAEKLEFIDMNKDVRVNWSKIYGPKIIFEKIWHELGLADSLTKCAGDDKERKTDPADVVFSQVLNKLLEPKSELATSRWVEQVYGLEVYDINHYYRSLDFLIEHKDRIEQDLYAGIKDLFNLEVDLVLFDTSSIIYRGDGGMAEEILDYGFSKEKRFDLKQVVIGVLMSKCGLPLAHFVYPGNTNDFGALRAMLEEAKTKFPIRRIAFVFDKGMTSYDNLKRLAAENDEYIAGVRIRQLSEEKQQQLLTTDGMKKVSPKLRAKEVIFNNQGTEERYIVCFNPEQAEKDRLKREEIIARLKKGLKTKGLKSLLVSKEYAKYVIIKADKPTLNKDRIKKEEFFDGKFALTTNNQSLSPAEVVNAYKDLQKVERAFRCLKSELEIGPIYHYTESRIRAHIMVAFLALVMRITLEKKLKNIDKDLSYLKVLEDVKQIRACKITLKNNSSLVTRTELPGQAHQAFRALKTKIPPRILQSEGRKICSATLSFTS